MDQEEEAGYEEKNMLNILLCSFKSLVEHQDGLLLIVSTEFLIHLWC